MSKVFGSLSSFRDFSEVVNNPEIDKMIDLEDVKNLMKESKILGDKHKRTLNLWYPFSKYTWKLIYRASKDGFESEDFHEKCDEKDNTLVIFKTKNNSIFGGYTPLKWSSNLKSKKYDPKSFVYSLVNNPRKDKPCYFKNDGERKYSIGVGKFLSSIVFGYEDIYVTDDEISTEHFGTSFTLKGYSNAQLKTYFFGKEKTTIKEIEIFQRGLEKEIKDEED